MKILYTLSVNFNSGRKLHITSSILGLIILIFLGYLSSSGFELHTNYLLDSGQRIKVLDFYERAFSLDAVLKTDPKKANEELTICQESKNTFV